MKVNINTLKLIKNDNHVRIAITNEGHYKEYPTFFVVSKDEYYEYVRDCMLGRRTTYPYVPDGNNILQFLRTGLTAAYLGRTEAEYFEFPSFELAYFLDFLFEADEPTTLDLTPNVQEWSRKYAPKVEVVYDDNVVESSLKNDVCHPLLVKEVEFISRLKNIAAGYSNGNPIVIAVYFDGRKRNDKPNDYYWEIREEGGERIMNGGFIAHLVGDNQYEYGIHT